MTETLLQTTDTAVQTAPENVVQPAPNTFLDQLAIDTNKGLIEVDGLNQEYKESKIIQKYMKDNKLDVNDLAKGLINVNTLIGKKLTEADAETLKTLNTKLGIPNDVSEYELPAIDGKDKFADMFKNVALSAKLDKDTSKLVYEKLIEADQASQLEKIEEEKQAIADSKAKLIEEFKELLPVKIAEANKALDIFGNKELKDTINKSGLGYNAEFIKFLASVGAKHNAKEVSTDVERSISRTKEDVQAEMQAIRNNPQFMNKLSPQSEVLADKLHKLYVELYG